MRIVLDESVAADVEPVLEAAGHQVISLRYPPHKGLSNGDIWSLVIEQQAVLITRDYHFTNPVRYDPSRTQGVIFLRAGNATARAEAELIERFLSKHSLSEFAGRLVSLSPNEIRVR